MLMNLQMVMGADFSQRYGSCERVSLSFYYIKRWKGNKWLQLVKLHFGVYFEPFRCFYWHKNLTGKASSWRISGCLWFTACICLKIKHERRSGLSDVVDSTNPEQVCYWNLSTRDVSGQKKTCLKRYFTLKPLCFLFANAERWEEKHIW